jgi:hypothetical protein
METENSSPAADEAATPKIKAMRRQPCPCGSGKVFKNCHEGDPGYEVATDPTTATHAPVTAAGPSTKGPAQKGFQGPAHNKFSSQGHGKSTSHRRKV